MDNVDRAELKIMQQRFAEIVGERQARVGLVVVQRQGDNGRWCADRPNLPGSPIVGRGDTWLEALGDLLIQDVETFGVTAYVVDQDGRPMPFRFLNRQYMRPSEEKSMSLDIDLVETGPVRVSLCCSAGVVRFFTRTGPGDVGLVLGEPVPKDALIELKRFLDIYLEGDDVGESTDKTIDVR